MSHLERTIKENYNKYLLDSDLTSIDIKDLKAKVSELYYPNKTELKEFVKKCMKEMTKDSPDEYPGDLVINNIFFDIYQDDELNINRIYNEIKLFQENNNNL